jgi:hypothetical protein
MQRIAIGIAALAMLGGHADAQVVNSENHGAKTIKTAQAGKRRNLVHRERGVKITIPPGWRRGNRRGKYIAPRVIGGYEDNMSITITKPFVLNKKNAKTLIRVVTGQFKKMFADYRMKSAQVRKIGRHKGIHIVGTVTVKGHRLLVDQVIIATPKAGVMVGCNYPIKRKGTTGKLCRRSFKSVR